MRWRRRATEPTRPVGLIVLVAVLPWGTAAAQAVATRADYLQRLDRDGDGRISLSEYQSYLTRGFRDMDRDGDGILRGDELPVASARPRRLEDLLTDLTRQFAQLDRDGDGYLDAVELTAPPR
jgi:Ca2+-binding EF-hand superfamily protein